MRNFGNPIGGPASLWGASTDGSTRGKYTPHSNSIHPSAVAPLKPLDLPQTGFDTLGVILALAFQVVTAGAFICGGFLLLFSSF